MTATVRIATGRYNLMAPSEESVYLHVKYGEAGTVLNLDLPIEHLDEFDSDENEPWPDLIERFCEKFLSVYWITTQRAQIQAMRDWLKDDDNNDEMLIAWARTLYLGAKRRRDRAQEQLDEAARILGQAAVEGIEAGRA